MYILKKSGTHGRHAVISNATLNLMHSLEIEKNILSLFLNKTVF